MKVIQIFDFLFVSRIVVGGDNFTPESSLLLGKCHLMTFFPCRTVMP